MLEKYLEKFAKLNADKSAARWPASTNHQAPYKPFMLLSVFDLVAQGVIQQNFIEYKADLLDIFDLYWVKVMGTQKRSNPVLPFYHLHRDGFWHLVSVPGMEIALLTVDQIKTNIHLQQMVLGAKFDDVLFDLILNAEDRDKLRRVLIEKYFAPDTRDILVEVGQITAESFEYSRKLVDRLRGRFTIKENTDKNGNYHTESRSAAFRRTVVDAYHHTCAMCGIRLVTPEGRTVVEAAHIIPWRVNQNDDPRNGVALCGLHHWTFDQGMVSISSSYEIMVSPIVDDAQQATQPVLLLQNRGLLLPHEKIFWPAKKALNWHKKNIFRAEIPPQLL